jgi:hypothetical protein
MRSLQPQKSALNHTLNCCLKASPLELRLLRLGANFAEGGRVLKESDLQNYDLFSTNEWLSVRNLWLKI